MTAKPIALLMSDLGVTKSHSRPHVADDNPYSEAHFRTLKYAPSYPDRFGALLDARQWSHDFLTWYNQEHHHSGLALLTPADVHYGRSQRSWRNGRSSCSRHTTSIRNALCKASRCRPITQHVWINQPAPEP